VEGIVVNQFQPRASLPQRTVQELVDEGLPVLAALSQRQREDQGIARAGRVP
jgi:chromosome partitioning protein